MDVSVVVPIHNERESLRPLYASLVDVLPPLGSFELIFVNDGSTDGSGDELDRLADGDPCVGVVELRRNFGQTAALAAGIRAARGAVIVTMDGDLQNDPADIPALLATLHAGYDLVHGWRRRRHDPWLTRGLPSRLANRLIAAVTGFPAHDLGCGLKAIRREIAEELPLRADLHRFVPVLAHSRGARCAEQVVNHRPRRFGQSKYGLSRTPRVLSDLITVKFLIGDPAGPMKLFGAIGLFCAAAGLASLAATIAIKLGGGTDMTGNPLLLLAVFSIISSLQFVGLGLLGARIEDGSRGQLPYSVRRTRNLGAGPSRTDRPAELRRAA